MTKIEDADIGEVTETNPMVTKPVLESAYTLEELVEGITAENRHEEIDFGPPVGNEFW